MKLTENRSPPQLLILLLASCNAWSVAQAQPAHLSCPNGKVCTRRTCTVGPRITGVATRNTFAGEPAVQPKSIELALSPQANLAYSTGEFRLTYSYTSLTTGQKEERTLSGKLESSAISQLRSSAIAPAQKDVTQLFIEETKLYVLGEGTRSSPFLSAWTLKCDLKK